MKTLIVMFSATGMLLSSGWSFAGGCSSEVVEFIRLKGGTKEGALSKISNEVSDAKRSYAAGTWGKGQVSGAERKELFDFMMQETSEMISNIRTCTERDLASITPKAKGTQSSSAASNCPKEIRIKYPTDQFGNFVDDTYRYIGGKDYEQVIHTPTKTETYKNTFGKDLAARVEDAERDMSWLPELRKLAEWGRCHLSALEGNHSSAASANASAASAQSGPNVGNASEANGQRSNRKNVFNPSSPQGSSAQSQAGPSDGECKSGDPSCAIRDCNRSGGKTIAHRDNLGCGVVSCRYADTKNDWSSVYNNVPGSGCAGSTK